MKSVMRVAVAALTFPVLTGCVKVEGALTINGEAVEFAHCETGERDGVADAVGFHIEQAPGYFMVQEVDGAAVLHVPEYWSLSANVSLQRLIEVPGCGQVELTPRSRTTDGVYPVDGSFELNCVAEVDEGRFEFLGGGVFSRCA